MILVTRLFLALCALVFILIGLNTFSDPKAAMASVEWIPQTTSALNETRANYGGLQIMIGLLLCGGVFSAHKQASSLLLNAAVTGGLAFGRVVSLVLDGTPNDTMMLFLGIEITIMVLSLAFRWRVGVLNKPDFE